MIDTPIVTVKTGNETFLENGKNGKISLSDFWQWSASDLLNNAMRGVLAEFIVGTALECKSEFRVEWDAYDLQTKSGLRVEVKSAAYLQSWKQEKLSAISFGIAPTFGWNAKTNEYSTEKERQSDVYVFCLLDEQDPAKINPMDLDQWKFYVLATEVLNESVGAQKTIRLKPMIGLGAERVGFSGLKDAVDKISPKKTI